MSQLPTDNAYKDILEKYERLAEREKLLCKELGASKPPLKPEEVNIAVLAQKLRVSKERHAELQAKYKANTQQFEQEIKAEQDKFKILKEEDF